MFFFIEILKRLEQKCTKLNCMNKVVYYIDIDVANDGLFPIKKHVN